MNDIFKVIAQEQQAGKKQEDSPKAHEQIMERIQQDINENPVLLYMKGTPEFPQCGFSAAVVEILEGLQISYASRNVLEDHVLRDAIKKFSSWPTIPQVYVKGEFIGGCDIVTDMHMRGELRPLLDKAWG